MAKNLKLNIKNAQIASAVNLGDLKGKLAGQKAGSSKEEVIKETKETESQLNAKKDAAKITAKTPKSKESASSAEATTQEQPLVRVRARSRSAFAEPLSGEASQMSEAAFESAELHTRESAEKDESFHIADDQESTELFVEEKGKEEKHKTSEEIRKEIFKEEIEEQQRQGVASVSNVLLEPQVSEPVQVPKIAESIPQSPLVPEQKSVSPPSPVPQRKEPVRRELPRREIPKYQLPQRSALPREFAAPVHKLGPTGKHIKDLLPPPPPKRPPPPQATTQQSASGDDRSAPRRPKPFENETQTSTSVGVGKEGGEEKKGPGKEGKVKEFRDLKPAIKRPENRFDARGAGDSDEGHHRRRRPKQMHKMQQEDVTVRPTTLKVRIPILLKDLAAEMKLKSSQLIAKLFAQGVIVTLNDLLEDETMIQLLGQDFGCDIQIDTSEEKRVRITDKTIREEVLAADPTTLVMRPPVVAFMGHVDHGKTSLIDAIRHTNRAAGEAGAITQHIGAFRCSTPVGDLAILDTPGHEAFSAMRARGADVTDIVVLVVAGDEGIKQQTIEAIEHAKAAKVTIVVAINKCDKPNFNPEQVYRQLSELELLPEAWGGQTITINCSAVTKEGVPQLLEMLALQAEVLELRTSPSMRARGSVLESEMHKGMGAVATVLIQNGTLRCGDMLVFGQHWGRVKTMRDEYNKDVIAAGPSTPVSITGLSGLPEAGEEFIVVKSEKEARSIADARMIGMRQSNLLQVRRASLDNLMQQASATSKKILNLVLRADVQGSLEALKTALVKIVSTKAEINILFAGVGEISESDVQLAATSKAVIIGFHTQIESHADVLLKELGIQVRLHNIIYHAVDDAKELLKGLLDKIAQENEKGKAEVRAIFKSSHYGNIIGCIVTEGSIHRNNSIRVRRGKEVVWKGNMLSLRRVKEDVREVNKGIECGVVLNGFNDALEGDILEAYETIYITQEL